MPPKGRKSIRGRKKAEAEKEVENVETPVAGSEDDAEMTPVEEDDAAVLEKILIDEEESAEGNLETTEEPPQEEEKAKSVNMEIADPVIEKPLLDDTATTDDTAKTDDTAEDLAIIIDNDEVLTSEAVENAETVKDAKGVPEIYSEELPSKQGDTPKKSSEFIRKLVACRICDSTCTRGVSMACCGTQACRGCATKAVTSKKICWGCPLVVKTNDFINDEELRTAAKLFREGEFIPREMVVKIRARLAEKKPKQENKRKQAKKEGFMDGKMRAGNAVEASFFESDFPLLMKIYADISPDCKAVTWVQTGFSTAFVLKDHPAFVIRKGKEVFAYRIISNPQPLPLQGDAVKNGDQNDIKKFWRNRIKSICALVPAEEAKAAEPTDIVTFNLVLQNKDQVKLAPGLSDVLVDLVPAVEGGGEAPSSFSQEKVFVFSEAKENPLPSPLKILNQVFCVVKEDSSSVRLILNNPGSEEVTLEGSRVLGQATILHAGNFEEALLRSEEQRQMQRSLGVHQGNGAGKEGGEVAIKTGNKKKKNKNKNKKAGAGGPIEGVTVKKNDFKPGNKKPVVDLRSKLTAKKTTAATAKTVGGVTPNKNLAKPGAKKNATVTTPTAAGKNPAVVSSADTKASGSGGHVWEPRGPKRKNEIPATGPSPAKMPRNQNNSKKPVSNNRNMPGNNHQMNGNNRQKAGNNKQMAGNNKPMVGNNRPMAGNNKQIAGNNRPMAGNNKPMAGNNRPMAGNNRPMTGNNRPMAGNNRPMAGNNRPMAGNNRPMAGNNRPAMAGNNHRDNFGQTRINSSFNGGAGGNRPMNGGAQWKPFGPPAIKPFATPANGMQGYGGRGNHDFEVERRAIEQQRLVAERRMLEQEQKERLFQEEKRDRERKLHLAKLDEELMMERNRIKRMREELARSRTSNDASVYSRSMDEVSSDRMKTGGDSIGSRNTRDYDSSNTRDYDDNNTSRYDDNNTSRYDSTRRYDSSSTRGYDALGMRDTGDVWSRRY